MVQVHQPVGEFDKDKWDNILALAQFIENQPNVKDVKVEQKLHGILFITFQLNAVNCRVHQDKIFGVRYKNHDGSMQTDYLMTEPEVRKLISQITK